MSYVECKWCRISVMGLGFMMAAGLFFAGDLKAYLTGSSGVDALGCTLGKDADGPTATCAIVLPKPCSDEAVLAAAEEIADKWAAANKDKQMSSTIGVLYNQDAAGKDIPVYCSESYEKSGPRVVIHYSSDAPWISPRSK